jgi:hypothetical protein
MLMAGDLAAHRSTYPPLDVLKPVAQDIWIVDSGPLWLLGMPIPLRMTVIRLANSDILLHSPTRCSDDLRREIERLGRIRHLIAPNPFHWRFIQQWRAHCPDTIVTAPRGLSRRYFVRRAGLKIDRELTETAPAEWAGQLDQTIIPARFLLREVAFFHRLSRTLVLTDLVVNLESEKIPLLRRPGARLLGVVAPGGKAPLYSRLLFRLNRRTAADAVWRLLAWNPARVIFSHGKWFEEDGSASLRRSLAWLLDEDRER